jgi:S1-C subfamily serine protease
VIFDDEGHILTNNHVVEGAQQIQVILSDGREFEGEVIGRAPNQDIAVIKIEGDDLPVATLGDSTDLKVGEWVVAIGNALGLQGGATVTTGIVSALNRAIGGGAGQPELENLVQTDAAINPGNSGGPLVNLDGDVIGINTATIQGAEGIGFAVAIDEAERIMQEILTGEPGPYLGISGAEITPGLAARFNLPVETGVLIASVEQGGPAEQAGIQAGDIFVSIDGVELTSVDDLRAALSQHQPGDQVTLVVLQESGEQEVTVTLGESSIVLE